MLLTYVEAEFRMTMNIRILQILGIPIRAILSIPSYRAEYRKIYRISTIMRFWKKEFYRLLMKITAVPVQMKPGIQSTILPPTMQAARPEGI